MDVSDFYQTFFDEADELLADMEKYLLQLDAASPDKEMMDAIFRAAHSIKGGAGTFGFKILQETTHLMENLLDDARCGKLRLTSDIINLFLESKDIMQDQLDAYKSSQEPDEQSFQYICEALRQIALQNKEGVAEPVQQTVTAQTQPEKVFLDIVLFMVKEQEAQMLAAELANLGTILSQQFQQDRLLVQLETNASVVDIESVLCFILEPEQIAIE